MMLNDAYALQEKFSGYQPKNTCLGISRIEHNYFSVNMCRIELYMKKQELVLKLITSGRIE